MLTVAGLALWPFLGAIYAVDHPVQFGSTIIKKQVGTLEYSLKLVIAKDGSIVGIELLFHNLSDTKAIKLRRYDPALFVKITRDGKNLDQSGLDSKSKIDASPPRRLDDAELPPGKSEEFFVALSSLIDLQNIAEHLDRCVIMVLPLNYPIGERPRGIDTFYRATFFDGCAITASELKSEVRKAYDKMKAQQIDH